MTCRTRLLSSLSLIAFTATPAFAASSDIEEILVTDTMSNNNLQQVVTGGALGDKSILDTPFSISVVDSEDIAKRQAFTIGQIFANDPSVFSFATGATTNWWGTQIRGLGVNNYYIDNVPLQMSWGGDFPIEAVERVEALKGLTGFMYGFGSPGGAIQYRTKRPTPEPMLATELGYRNDSVFYGRVDAGGPIDRDGRLGLRANLGVEQGTAYNDAGVNRYVGSLAADFAISPNLKWFATLTYEDSNLKHEPFQIYWDSYTGTEVPDTDFRYGDVNVDNSNYKAKTFTSSTGLNWRFADGWSAEASYGYNRKKHLSNKTFVDLLNEDGDYAGAMYNFPGVNAASFGNLMIEGGFDTGFIRHEIVSGLSYQTQRNIYGEFYYSYDFDGNVFEEQTFLVTRDIDWDLTGTPSKNRQTAAFISDTLHLGDHVQAIVGLRHSRQKILDMDGDPAVDSSFKTSATTPTLALIYKPIERISLYGSYVESLEGGTRVGDTYANAGEILGATISKQYEVGVKYQDMRLGFTTAAFRIERANRIDEIIDGLRYLTQDGLVVYEGIEAIANYRFTQRLSMGGGLVYLDPEIREVSPGNAAIMGHIPAQASKWQIVGNADYRVPGIEGLSLHGNVRHYGKAPTTDANTLFLPSYTLANLGFTYEMEVGGQPIALVGNVNNIFDKAYWGLSNFGEGRNAALGLRVNW